MCSEGFAEFDEGFDEFSERNGEYGEARQPKVPPLIKRNG